MPGLARTFEVIAVDQRGIPGVSPAYPLVLPPQLNERLWHIAFNQLDTINEQLVEGR